MPGSGVIMIMPVSVCHHVSTTGQRPPLPARLGNLFDRQERCSELAGDYATVAAFVAQHAVARGG